MSEAIAVDLDGVCYEWSRTAMYMLRRYRGCTFPDRESTSWDYIQSHVSGEDWKWLWADGIQKGLFRFGHMVKDARIGLEALDEEGYDLVIVSHRPKSAVVDTIKWASYYFEGIPLKGFHILTEEEPKTEVPWDLLIDDKPENVAGAWAAGRKAVLFDQPWNQDSVHFRATWETMDWSVKNVLKGV